MMEDVRIVGATKLDTALTQMIDMLKTHEDSDGVKINDVAIIVDMVEKVPGKEYTAGSILYACSDERSWVQSAFFERAAMAVSYDPVSSESED